MVDRLKQLKHHLHLELFPMKPGKDVDKLATKTNCLVNFFPLGSGSNWSLIRTTVDPDLLSYASESETLTLELNIVCYTRYKYIKNCGKWGSRSRKLPKLSKF